MVITAIYVYFPYCIPDFNFVSLHLFYDFNSIKVNYKSAEKVVVFIVFCGDLCSGVVIAVEHSVSTRLNRLDKQVRDVVRHYLVLDYTIIRVYYTVHCGIVVNVAAKTVIMLENYFLFLFSRCDFH